MDIAMPMDDREFHQKVAKTRGSYGYSAEMYVAGTLIEMGFIVSKPVSEGCKYDLIVDTGSKLLRVQVKSVGGKYIQIPIGWTIYRENIFDGKGVTGHVVRKYTESDFDILAGYHRLTRTVYYVSMDDLDLSKDNFQIRQDSREKFLDFPK